MRKTAVVLFLLSFAAYGQTHGRLLDYALILVDPPVARNTHSRLELGGTAARQNLGRIRTAQSGVMTELKRRHVAVTGTGQILVNAVFVSATRDTAAQLSGIP